MRSKFLFRMRDIWNKNTFCSDHPKIKSNILQINLNLLILSILIDLTVLNIMHGCVWRDIRCAHIYLFWIFFEILAINKKVDECILQKIKKHRTHFENHILGSIYVCPQFNYNPWNVHLIPLIGPLNSMELHY